ncbi:MAG: tetratricopeptide repeat-containing sensor histidine kinase [Rhizobacter sp.]|nr:tetratricopeptide repeat-containing sensor histidine kinase [Chlorobiales bacterium]
MTVNTSGLDETLASAAGSSEAKRLNDQAAELAQNDPSRARALAESAEALAIEYHSVAALAQSLATQAYCNYLLSNYEHALSQSFLALSSFQSVRDAKGELFVLKNIGNVYHRIGDYSKSLRFQERSLDLARQLGERREEAAALNNIGGVYISLSDHAAALEYLYESLTLLQRLGERALQASTLGNLGAVYEYLDDDRKALECYDEGLSLTSRTGTTPIEALLLRNKAKVYEKHGDYEAALSFYHQSLDIRRAIGDKHGEASSLHGVAGAYLKLGDYAQATHFFGQSLSLRCFIGDRMGEAEVLLDIGKLCLNQPLLELPKELLMQLAPGKAAKVSEYCLLRSLAGAEAAGVKRTLYQASQLLAEFYEQQGDYGKAIMYLKKYHAAEREIFNDEQSQRTRALRNTFDISQAKKESEIFQLRNEKLTKANDALAEVIYQLERLKVTAEAHRKAAEDASAFKSEFLAIAAHDLRNPLSAINGFAELIRESESLGSVKNMAEIIGQSSGQMFSLISDLLRTAQLDAGKLELRKSLVNLSLLVEYAVSRVEPMIQKKSQRINLSVSPNVRLLIDEERMREAIDNIIGNAVKYSPQGKTIWVSLARGHRFNPHTEADAEKLSVAAPELTPEVQQVVRIEVRDEGQGLDLDDLKKVFGKFQRLSSRPTGDESSTGLGLSIVKQLVELHGGKVWAESQGKDMGSVFIIELPVYE